MNFATAQQHTKLSPSHCLPNISLPLDPHFPPYIQRYNEATNSKEIPPFPFLKVL
jgi:hypothetical protein